MDRAKKATLFWGINLTIWTAAIVCGAIMLAVAMLGGCTAHTRLDPPKTEVSVTRTEYDPSGRPTATVQEKVQTQGPGGQSSGDNAQVKAEGEAPTAETASIKTGGGKMKADGAASIEKSATARIIVGIIGFLLIIGGCAGLYLRQPIKAAAGTAVIGLGLLTCAIFPSIALYTLAGLALYAAVSLWLAGFDAAKFREALRAVAAGVDDHIKANPTDAGALLERIGAHAEEGDKRTIRKVKNKDGLKN